MVNLGRVISSIRLLIISNECVRKNPTNRRSVASSSLTNIKLQSLSSFKCLAFMMVTTISVGIDHQFLLSVAGKFISTISCFNCYFGPHVFFLFILLRELVSLTLYNQYVGTLGTTVVRKNFREDGVRTDMCPLVVACKIQREFDP
jgi:hypothetical protein